MTSLRRFYESADRSGAPGPDRVAAQLGQLDSVPRPARARLRMLDLGCGDGTLSVLAAARARPAVVVAVDWNWADAAAAGSKGVIAVQAGVDEVGLPFRSGTFDVVLMSEVIEHLVDPDLALAEARRVLGSGGVLLLSTPNLAAWFNRLLLLAGVQPVFSEVSRMGIFGRPGHVVVGHLRLFTARALRELLEAHGFVEVSLAGASYHDIPRCARWFDRLVARRPSVAAIILARAGVGDGPGR